MLSDIHARKFILFYPAFMYYVSVCLFFSTWMLHACHGAVPNWTPTYDMAQSTVIMPCNYSGFYDFESYPQLAKFGVVDFDWSNAKLLWDNESPMACESALMKQAQMYKAVNPSAKVFLYRNIVKALPWFEEVREKLADPNYWGWFLHYKPSLRNGTSAGGNLYHDEEQTPGWPGGGNGGPDGVCHNNTQPPWGRGCDCGQGIPCGEYLFDHRNESLRTWLTEQYMAGSKFGLGNPLVDGFYLDDDWSENGVSITSPNTRTRSLPVSNARWVCKLRQRRLCAHRTK
eukprot:m.284141 g.284141  ORF g.284141 m.284141 type:complete len:286 (-) comp19899_c0_seq12:795-1652(-)